MSSKPVKVAIVLLCLLALVVPSPAKSVASETSSPQITTPPAGVYVSTEVNLTSLAVGETTLVSVKLNNVPVEGYKSAEFTCTYNAALIEKSNIAFTDLFGVDPATAIHDPQNGTFIVAISGAHSNRAMVSGTAFSFNVKGLQAGQSVVQCAGRVSIGNNLAVGIPSIGADLTVLAIAFSPTPFVPATETPGHHDHATATSAVVESPTPIPNGSLTGQIIASKPVTLRLLDANDVEVTSLIVNPDGTFMLTPLPGDYTLTATASGYLSYYGSVTITAGSSVEYPVVSLLAGDVDGNLVIDQFDALTIGMNYTLSTPAAADLNNDVVIDFLDLELLAENYRQTGPTVGSASSSIFGLLQKKKPTPTGSPFPGLTKTVITPAATSSPGPVSTVIGPALTRLPDITGAPYPGAPLCPDSGTSHNNSLFHTLWDSARGCHYDHEHGENPFTPEVAAAFPGFDLRSLLGNVQIGHTNPSGPMENTHKHPGFKWQVQLNPPNGCALDFEGADVAVNAIAIQYHAFGDYSMEFESRVHSAGALMRQCVDNSGDYGYIYVVQHVDYGQRVSGYQGNIIPYADTPNPAYAAGLAPYFSVECVGRPSPPCGRYADYASYVADAPRANTTSTWTTKSNFRLVNSGSPLLAILMRMRDNYQIFDWTRLDGGLSPAQSYLWMCSSDGGLTYNGSSPCRYNNTTTRVHEVAGVIPATWDNLQGFDTNPTIGRITATGFVSRFGVLNSACTTPGIDCHPIKLVNAFVGHYGSMLFPDKEPAFIPPSLPERDIYFCGGVVCSETSPGAVPSGWVGSGN